MKLHCMESIGDIHFFSDGEVYQCHYSRLPKKYKDAFKRAFNVIKIKDIILANEVLANS